MAQQKSWHVVVHFPTTKGVAGWINIVKSYSTQAAASKGLKQHRDEIQDTFKTNLFKHRKIKVMNKATLERLMKTHVILEGRCNI